MKVGSATATLAARLATLPATSNAHGSTPPWRPDRESARRLTSQPVTETGWRWQILADPDGNELCVLQPPAGYW